MHIWVDADACPQVIKEIRFRAAECAQVLTTLVSNMALSRTPLSPYIRTIQVAKGFDGADQRIVAEMQPGDLGITADLPLAAEVVTRGGHALDPRGDLYFRGQRPRAAGNAEPHARPAGGGRAARRPGTVPAERPGTVRESARPVSDAPP
jgi:uncharacterized protein YaiI (UPF0178 family)